ncbi:MAG: 5'/3'-nucleotidase SurE [Halocynthiibacter sp.]
MRILITNDDGINARGLQTLEAIGAEIAGPDGEVVVVAPAFEQSGVGHCISYTRPMLISEFAPNRYAVEGTPADCVLAGIYDVSPDKPFDLILSGINRGNNSAQNALYSGTLGAAIEGALQGVLSIALSQYLGPDNYHADDPFDAAGQHGVAAIKRILNNRPPESDDYRLYYNVNFPPVAAKDVKGTRITSQGFRRDADFSVVPQESPTGRKYLWIKGGPQHTPTLDGTDANANVTGYISITPMRADFSDHAEIKRLREAAEE